MGQPTAEQFAAAESDPRCRKPSSSGLASTVVDDGALVSILPDIDHAAARRALRAGRVVVFDRFLISSDGTVRLHVDTPDREPTGR